MATKLPFAACLALAFFIGGSRQALAQEISIQQFAFLEGSWVMKEGNREFHETWTKVNDTKITGFGFMLAKGDTVMREVLHLEKIGRHWVYIAAIDNSAPTLFTLSTPKNNTFVFENKEHNFPQRIGYRLKPDGSLDAWIEGKLLGKTRKEEFPMQRVKSN